VRLRLVETVDFRKSDMTIWLELESRHHKLAESFGPNDVAAVKNSHGTQLMFLSRPVHLGSTWVFRSERLRLTSGSWNPLRLTDYANSVGLHLENLPTFEDILRRITGALK
jgi:hypothetical protein